MSRTPRLIPLAALGIVAALSGALLARSFFQSPAPPTLASGTLLQPTRPLPPFALLDQSASPFGPERFTGHWSFLFFGFTNCGDVCPTTLTLLSATTKALVDVPQSQRPQVVFVSVDARRDTPAAIAQYLRNFDPAFVGVTGAQGDLDTLARALGVPSGFRMLDNGGYAVDHSASILAVNPRGELRALFSPPHTVDALANDFRLLLKDKG